MKNSALRNGRNPANSLSAATDAKWRQEGRRFMVPTLVFLLWALTAFLGQRLTDHQTLFENLVLLMFPVMGILVLRNLVKLRPKQALSHAVALLIVILVSRNIFVHLDAPLRSLRIQLHAERYASCIAQAANIGDGHFFNVCEGVARSEGDNYIYEHAIIYDSSDLIIKGQGSHTDNWRRVIAETFHNLTAYKVTPIKDHFYSVLFSWEEQPSDGWNRL